MSLNANKKKTLISPPDHSEEPPFESSHRPRQFDLLSYFFSDETTEHNVVPYDPQPVPQVEGEQVYPISSTSEKSFFDVLRDGLNYIDSNDEHVEKILVTSGDNATITDAPLPKNTTGISLLDIFLNGDVDDDDDDDDDHDYPDDKSEIIGTPFLDHGAHNETFYVANEPSSDLDYDRYTMLDEGPRPETTVPPMIVNSVKVSDPFPSVKTSNYDRSATEKIISEYITYTSVPNYAFETSTLNTSQDFETSTSVDTTTQEQSTVTPVAYETTNVFDEVDEANTGTSTLEDELSTEVLTREIETTSAHYVKNGTNHSTTTEASVVSTFFEKFSNLFLESNSVKEKHETRPQATHKETSTVENVQIVGVDTHVFTHSPSIPTTTRRVTPSIIASSTPIIITASPPTVPPTTTSTPSPTTNRSPIVPIVVVHTTKGTTSTKKSHPTTTAMPTTIRQQSTTSLLPLNKTKTSSKVNIVVSTSPNEHKPPPSTTTIPPPLIDSNPSILDSDLNYDYGDQPTLPPSLPNLKIIPFLPTDAVRKDNVHPKLDYYSTISTNYPVLTENYENNPNTDYATFEIDKPEVNDPYGGGPNENPKFNSYSIKTTGYANDEIFGIQKSNGIPSSADYSQYPSITEKPSVEPTIVSKYPIYNVDYDYEPFDSEKHLEAHQYAPGTYEVLDGHEYNLQSRNPSFEHYLDDGVKHSQIEFSTSNPLFGYNGNNKFSPPSKTEGNEFFFFFWFSSFGKVSMVGGSDEMHASLVDDHYDQTQVS